MGDGMPDTDDKKTIRELRKQLKEAVEERDDYKRTSKQLKELLCARHQSGKRTGKALRQVIDELSQKLGAFMADSYVRAAHQDTPDAEIEEMLKRCDAISADVNRDVF